MTPTVSFPARGTITESRQVIVACTELERVPGTAVLDLTGATMLGPFGVAALAASIAQRRTAGLVTEILLPTDLLCGEFVDEVGLVRFAGGRAIKAGTLELHQCHALDPTYTAAVADMLVRSVNGIDEAAA
ncbi:MAG: hypothetical protein JW751_32065 [Polyangiaceae bacterium]|nr:hypothetical protein [Polyangiaceae bacterium]